MSFNIFSQVYNPKVKSNTFSLSHDVKLSTNMGWLTPTCCEEVLPGDYWTIAVENMFRFAPLVSPVMHDINIHTEYFFVPTRLLWSEFTDAITGNTEPAWPTLQGFNTATEELFAGSLGDYLGYNYCPHATESFTAFQAAAYCLIYDEWYRDQNLHTTDKFTPLVAGDNSSAYMTTLLSAPFLRSWKRDYFTGALPFAQKGDEVMLPLGDFLDVDVDLSIQPAPNVGMRVKDIGTNNINNADVGSAAANGTLWDLVSNQIAFLDPNGNLIAKTSELENTTAPISTVRRAFALQRFLEKDARGGTRYTETILMHFAQRSSDARLQRPEFIGSTRQKMVISEVLSTAETDDGTLGANVGYMAGHGISTGGGRPWRFKAEEHGYIIGIVTVLPRTAYQQGVHKSFTRKSRLDYAWPSFAHIGEEEVQMRELYLSTATVEELDNVFGYVPRYSSYKHKNSRVAGHFKTTLDYWHLGRIFGSTPALNAEFIEALPSTRIFADQSNSHHIYAHIFNHMKVNRRLPRFGIPKVI